MHTGEGEPERISLKLIFPKIYVNTIIKVIQNWWNLNWTYEIWPVHKHFTKRVLRRIQYKTLLYWMNIYLDSPIADDNEQRNDKKLT